MKSKVGTCFWCGRVTDNITKDHLVSIPLAKILVRNGVFQKQSMKSQRSAFGIVQSCYGCNHTRAAISSLVCHLFYIQNAANANRFKVRHLNKWIKQQVKLGPSISYFRDKINSYLPAKKAIVCLMELDELNKISEISKIKSIQINPFQTNKFTSFELDEKQLKYHSFYML